MEALIKSLLHPSLSAAFRAFYEIVNLGDNRGGSVSTFLSSDFLLMVLRFRCYVN